MRRLSYYGMCELACGVFKSYGYPRNWLHVLQGWCLQNVGVALYCLLRELNEWFELPHLSLVADLSYSVDRFYTVGNRMHHIFGMSDGGVRDALVTELHRIRNPFAYC